MRGKVLSGELKDPSPGITPAHAGKRTYGRKSNECHKDHPRTCGEKFIFTFGKMNKRGSPPHMRGKGTDDYEECQINRITPAHAGKRLKESLKTAIKLMKKISFHSVCYKLHIKADNPQQLYDFVHPLFQSMKQPYRAYNYPTL